MDQIPLNECHKQLNSLSYSPILGNRQAARTVESNIPKPTFLKPASKTLSATSVAAALSPGKSTPRKRLYSQTNLSPSELESSAKMTKDNTEIKEILANIAKDNAATNKNIAKLTKEMSETKSQISESETRLGEKFENNFKHLTEQISDLRSRQDLEAQARETLERHVDAQFKEINDKIGDLATPSVEDFSDAIDTKIEAAVARHMKSKENQINATYFQSLANDLKLHEKDLMIYGFKTQGSPDLENEIRQKLFKDKLELDIGKMKAVQVGSENGDKPKPIRVSLESAELRNSIFWHVSKLPREIKIEKCLPQRYRQPNRDLVKYSWQLKQAINVQTRIVSKGHKLVLEYKEKNEGDIKYDWTIAKEYFPEPVSPTDRTTEQRSRLGLRPSKTIEQFGMNKVILSNLVVSGSSEETKEYFRNTFVDAADQEKVIEIDAEKVTDKKVMIVTLRTKQECSIFKNTYEEKLFNGQKPRISVLLCRD